MSPATNEANPIPKPKTLTIYNIQITCQRVLPSAKLFCVGAIYSSLPPLTLSVFFSILHGDGWYNQFRPTTPIMPSFSDINFTTSLTLKE
jgi:hypothetical protein